MGHRITKRGFVPRVKLHQNTKKQVGLHKAWAGEVKYFRKKMKYDQRFKHERTVTLTATWLGKRNVKPTEISRGQLGGHECHAKDSYERHYKAGIDLIIGNT